MATLRQTKLPRKPSFSAHTNRQSTQTNGFGRDGRHTTHLPSCPTVDSGYRSTRSLPTVRGQQKAPELHTRGTQISHPKKDIAKGIRSQHNPTKLLCLGPEKNTWYVLVKLLYTRLTNSSSREELNWPATHFLAQSYSCNP